MEGASILARWDRDLPDTRPFFDRWCGSSGVQLLLCLVVGLIVRMAAFGNPDVHIDEGFYFLVGQKMHEGALVYVDVWDRKPLGLFILYYLFAGISGSVLSYQIAAWLFASATAFVIVRIALIWTRTQGALLAGLTYLPLLNVYQGIGGQAPVFYNLFIAVMAFLVMCSRSDVEAGRIGWRVYLAMILGGIAITIKQTTLFEAAWLGLLVCWYFVKGQGRFPYWQATGMAALGVLPTGGIAAYYFAVGHWAEFWHAMVLSNLSKEVADSAQYGSRILSLAGRSWFLLILLAAALRWGFKERLAASYRPIVTGLLVAALLGYLVIPNIYSHYTLPLLVPVMVAVAIVFARKVMGLYAALVCVAVTLTMGHTFEFSANAANRRSMAHLAGMLEANAPRGTVLIYDAPPLLASLSGGKTLSPLLFPNHLNEAAERNVSHIDTDREMLRILAQRPGAIAMATKPRMILYNRENLRAVSRYIRSNCQYIGKDKVTELGARFTIVIYGRCAVRP